MSFSLSSSLGGARAIVPTREMILECLAIVKPTAIISVPALFNRVSYLISLVYLYCFVNLILNITFYIPFSNTQILLRLLSPLSIFLSLRCKHKRCTMA